MRLLLSFIFFAIHISLAGQALSFQALLDSGKREYRRQLPLPEPDYAKARALFAEAVRRQPGNTEARYFLGYTLDKLNARYGNEMDQIQKDLCGQASAQFEWINQHEPLYQGETLVQDPYSKISSIWGSLALHYISAGKMDSARWAFKEGKRRGGFLEPMLEVNRQLLNGCNQNAVLITYGDATTFPLYYLQLVEKRRTDVTVVDVNLVHMSWYDKLLKHAMGLSMHYIDQELDTLNYRLWQPTKITIPNPANPAQALQWQLKPTYGDYILRGDLVLLDIVRQNLFTRDFYFPFQGDSSMNLFLQPFLVNDGLADKLVSPADFFESLAAVSKNLHNYTIDRLDGKEIQKSPDAIRLLNNYRACYLAAATRQYYMGHTKTARELMEEMERKFPESKLPLPYQEFRDYYNQVKALVKQ